MNALKKYGAHLVGYILSAAGIVAGLDPALLPPQYGVAIAIAGLIVTASHHSFTAGTATAVATAAQKAITTAMVLIVALFAMVALHGCSLLKPATPQQVTNIALVVDAATSIAIQQEDTNPAIWKARAVDYKAIAVELASKNSTVPATLATLRADLAPLIAKLPPGEVLAANVFLAVVGPQVDQQLAGDPDVAVVRTDIGIVLQAVIDTCNAFGA